MKELSRSWLWRGLSFKHHMHVQILLSRSILVINNAWIITVLFFTGLFLGTNLNAIVLPCKLQCSAGKWRSWKSAVQECRCRRCGLKSKYWIEFPVMLGHVTLMLGHVKGWCCHFLEGYRGLIQSLLGLHRRLSMDYHGLLTSLRTCLYFSVCPSSSKGINCCLRTGPVLCYLRLRSKLWGWYPYKF